MKPTTFLTRSILITALLSGMLWINPASSGAQPTRAPLDVSATLQAVCTNAARPIW